jgi:ribonuclease BN (tRNA processing enzyme)
MTLSKPFAITASVMLAALSVPVIAADGATCPVFRWTTLGTAGGPIPTLERSEPANMLDADGMAILVDAGDGTVGQMARAGRSVGEVRNVFLSHLHLDHTAGLAGVVGLRWMNEHPGEITIYGPPGTGEVVAGIVASMEPPSRIGFGIGQAPSRPADRIKAVELTNGQVVKLGSLAVRAVANNHYDGAAKEAQRANALAFSYRFDLGDRSITYTGDTGPDPRVTALAEGTDLLVSEVIEVDQMIAAIKAQRPDLGEAGLAGTRLHFSTHHVTPEEVGKMAAEAAAKRVVLTHYVIPGPLGMSAQSLHLKVRASYSGTVDLARDLSSFDLGCKGK